MVGFTVNPVLGLGRITGLAGHCGLRVHLRMIGIYHKDTVCRLCGLKEDTAGQTIHGCESDANRMHMVSKLLVNYGGRASEWTAKTL